MPVTNLCKLLQRLDTTDASGEESAQQGWIQRATGAETILNQHRIVNINFTESILFY